MEENNFDKITPLPWLATDVNYKAGKYHTRFIYGEKTDMILAECGTNLNGERYLLPNKEMEANTKYILTACNAYPSLIEENKRLREIAKEVAFWFSNEANYPEGTNGNRIYKKIQEVIELNNKLSDNGK